MRVVVLLGLAGLVVGLPTLGVAGCLLPHGTGLAESVSGSEGPRPPGRPIADARRLVPTNGTAVKVLDVRAAGLSLAPTSGATAGDPVVGSGATYQWTSTLKQEVPVLVKQDQPGAQSTWTVSTESVTPLPLFVRYSILGGDAKSYVLQVVTRHTIEGMPLPAPQITVDRASAKALKSVTQRPKGAIATPERGSRPFRQGWGKGTEEDVPVPGGRFRAIRVPYQNGTVWVSDPVPAMGLAKAQLTTGQPELLKSSTSGAQDLLRS
jgi:hypothetical protein